MNPFSVSPNVCFSLCTKYGGKNCLQEVDIDMVHGLMEDLWGEELIEFVTLAYAHSAEKVYSTLHVTKLTLNSCKTR